MCNSKKFGIAGIVTGLIAIAYTFYVQMKMEKTCALIDTAVDNLSDDISVDISEEIINKAVTRAMDREVHKAVKSASEEAIALIRKDIQRDVKSSVEGSYTDVRASVSKEVAKQVADIDIKRLKDDATEKAKELIVEKFDGKLDSLLEEFNQNLSNVSKIYNSIADSMTKKRESETVFRIGN